LTVCGTRSQAETPRSLGADAARPLTQLLGGHRSSPKRLVSPIGAVFPIPCTGSRRGLYGPRWWSNAISNQRIPRTFRLPRGLTRQAGNRRRAWLH